MGLQEPGEDGVGALVGTVPGGQGCRVGPRLAGVGGGVAGVEQPGVDGLHEVGVDLAVEAERVRAGAVPEPRRFASVDGTAVVTLPAARNGVGEIADVVPGGDAQHGGSVLSAAATAAPMGIW